MSCQRCGTDYRVLEDAARVGAQSINLCIDCAKALDMYLSPFLHIHTGPPLPRITELFLTHGVENRLMARGILYVNHLKMMQDKDLLKIDGIGPVRLAIIRERIEEFDAMRAQNP